VNLGDSYSQAGVGARSGGNLAAWKSGGRRNPEVGDAPATRESGLIDKNLVGIPWRFAFAMQAAGWVLRSEIIWAKPNPMPESVRDRPTKAHEQLFLFSKGAKYFYDTAAAREAVSGTANPSGAGTNPKAGKWKTPDGWDTSAGKGGHGSFHKEGREKGRTRPKQNESFSAAVAGLVDDRNWRDVWTIGTEPYREAHFATFPTALPRRCILAGSRAGDLVLDPFGGSGTTAAVARELGRRAVICEANPEYAKLAESRIFATPPGLGI
jgi:site-specific DNA-methyltransferase (cytosine-N4-specific)